MPALSHISCDALSSLLTIFLWLLSTPELAGGDAKPEVYPTPNTSRLSPCSVGASFSSSGVTGQRVTCDTGQRDQKRQFSQTCQGWTEASAGEQPQPSFRPWEISA